MTDPRAHTRPNLTCTETERVGRPLPVTPLMAMRVADLTLYRQEKRSLEHHFNPHTGEAYMSPEGALETLIAGLVHEHLSKGAGLSGLVAALQDAAHDLVTVASALQNDLPLDDVIGSEAQAYAALPHLTREQAVIVFDYTVDNAVKDRTDVTREHLTENAAYLSEEEAWTELEDLRPSPHDVPRQPVRIVVGADLELPLDWKDGQSSVTTPDGTRYEFWMCVSELQQREGPDPTERDLTWNEFVARGGSQPDYDSPGT